MADHKDFDDEHADAAPMQLKFNLVKDQRHVYTAEWQKINAILPSSLGRAGHTAVVHKHGMYVYGGESSEGPLLDDLWMLDFASVAWRPIDQSGDVPCARDGHTAVVYSATGHEQDNEMFVFGGNDGAHRLNDLYCFNFAKSSWRKITDARGAVPVPRCRHSAVVARIRNQMYMVVYGGWDHDESFSEIHLYHFASNTWSVQAMAGSQERVWHACTVVPRHPQQAAAEMGDDQKGVNDGYTDDIYIHAGEDRNCYLHSELFRLTGSVWQKVLPHIDSITPEDRYGHSMAAVGDFLLIIGGYGGEDNMFNDVCSFSVEQRMWQKLKCRGSFPQARYGHTCVLYNERLYVMGGCNSVMNKLNDVYELCFLDPANAPEIQEEVELVIPAFSPPPAGVVAPASPWCCNVCTFENGPGTARCVMCTAPAPPDVQPLRDPNRVLIRPAPPGHAAPLDLGGGGGAGGDDDDDGDVAWSCGVCTLENRPLALACEACGTPKQPAR